MMEIRSKARRLKTQEPNLSLIIVDYLQLMTSGASAENRVQEVSQISRQLKVLARDLDTPVLAMSQLSRAVEQRHDKRPILSDLRESGCLTGDSRVFLPDTGTYVPIADLVGRDGVRVMALNEETWCMEPRRVLRGFARGEGRFAGFLTRPAQDRADREPQVPPLRLARSRKAPGTGSPCPGHSSPLRHERPTIAVLSAGRGRAADLAHRHHHHHRGICWTRSFAGADGPKRSTT